MENLKNILLDEIKEFNEIGRKFVSGEVSRGDFRNASCGMEVYAHRDGKNFMIRLRIAGGTDTANCTVTDMGFLAVTKAGKKYFKLFLGGGLGRNPSKGIEFDELVEPKDILYHIEAMTKLFEAEGDYENKWQARLRYLVKRMGESDFIKSYKYYLEKEKLNDNLNIEISEKEYAKEGILTEVQDERLFKQKQNGLYSVYVHPLCGQSSLENFKIVLYKLNHMKDSEIRLSKTEGFYIINLNGEEAEKVLQLTKNMSGTTRLEQSISCVGMPVCQIGILNSQQTLKEIIELFREKGITKDILPRVYISGCPNSCGTHEIGDIGFAGKKKKIDGELKNIFQLHMNGCTDADNTNLSKYFADILQEKVPEFLYELAVLVEEDGLEFHKWIYENKKKVEDLIQSFSV